MEPQTIPEQNLSSQTNKSYKRKSPVLIFLALVLVVVLLGYVTLFAKHKVTGLDVAIKTSTFLNQTVEMDGAIVARLVCTISTGQCSSRVLDANKPDLSGVVYGYNRLAKISGGESYNAKADQVMDFLLSGCRSNFQMCDWNTSIIAGYYLDTKDEKYLNALYSPIKKMLVWSNQELIDKDAGKTLALLYEATADESYRARLLEVADEELSNGSLDNNRVEYSIRVIQSVLIPAYTVSDDRKYLDASEKFFNSFNLVDNVDLSQMALESITKGIDALLDLSKMSDNGTVYRTQALSALQEVLYQSWDNPKNFKSNGDYGFGYPTVFDDNFVKNTLDNGWLVGLFAEVADKKFNLSITK